jgi:hypothetical protein
MKKSTLYLTGGYVIFLVLGFIGAPKQPFTTYALAFAFFTAFYWLAVWYIKKFIATK